MSAGSAASAIAITDPSEIEGMDAATALRAVAFTAYQSNLLETCRQSLEHLAEIAPDDPGLTIFELCQTGDRHSLDGRHYQAIEAFQQALALDPTSEMAALRLLQAVSFAGERLVRDGNAPEGLAFLKVALGIRPDDATLRNVTINALMMLAIEKLARGEIEPALDDYRQALTLADIAISPLNAINYCITHPVAQDTVMSYRLVLMSLLHNHHLSSVSVSSIGMGDGVLRNVAAQSEKRGERQLEAAALRLRLWIWGPNEAAQSRLAEWEDRYNKTYKWIRQQLFLSDRMTICYSPFVGHHGRPNGNYQLTSQFLDRDGFPNPSPPETPKQEARRVFVIGDSTIYIGDGSMETTVPGRMQKILHERGQTDVRIYNYAIPACTFHQPLALLSSKLMDYEPDEIMINIGGVDAIIHKAYDPRPGYPMWGFMFELAQEQRQRISAQADYSLRDHWRDLTERFLDMKHSAGSEMADEYYERVAAEFKLALNRLGRFADAYDIPVTVTLQPIHQLTRAPTGDDSRFTSARVHGQIYCQYKAFQSVAFPDQSRFTPWSKRLRVIDITDVFDHYDGQIYSDHVHYNTVGREIMAARMVEILES